MSILVFICVWFRLEMEEKLAQLKLFIESAILFYFLSSHFSLLQLFQFKTMSRASRMMH